MDKTDERILDIMKDDARISFQELGEKLGISRVAAMKRVRKLEDEDDVSPEDIEAAIKSYGKSRMTILEDELESY